MRQYIQLPIGFITGEPSGADGELIITNGQTVVIPGGSFKDYTRIDIQAGGTLTINDTLPAEVNQGKVTEILCRRDCTINGLINTIRNNKVSPSDTMTTHYYLPETISYTHAQQPAGAGGNGAYGWAWGGRAHGGSGGSSGSLGIGGGGGGGGGGSNTYGSDGGTNGSGGVPPSGGWYGFGYGTQGAGGGTGAGSSTIDGHGAAGASGGGAAYAGGGGGGGYRGKHGLVLYIKTRRGISGTGTIDLSGTNGFAGGNGANGNMGSHYSGGAGGGGGGGAGGNGGLLWLRHRGDSLALNINVSAGTGAAGGTKGATVDQDTGGQTNGGNGSNGAPGVATISTW